MTYPHPLSKGLYKSYKHKNSTARAKASLHRTGIERGVIRLKMPGKRSRLTFSGAMVLVSSSRCKSTSLSDWQ